MGRSVSYPSGAIVAFRTLEIEDEDDWEGEYECLVEEIFETARSTFPSLEPCDGWRGREDRKVRSERRRAALTPEGTAVVFAGGRASFATTEEAKSYADNIWATLDRVREQVPDMLLVHGGDGKGADRLAAAWAERHEVHRSLLPEISPARDCSRSLGERRQVPPGTQCLRSLALAAQ